MSIGYALPFLRPEEGTVNAGPWLRIEESGFQPLEDPVRDWDYSVDLVLSRKLMIDSSRLLSQCALQPGARVALIAHLATGDAALRRVVSRNEFALDDNEALRELDMEIHLSGFELQGNITLTTRMVLMGGEAKSQLAPSLPGSNLWEEKSFFQLEGGGGRLPMETADFNDVRPEFANAPWYLVVEIMNPEANFAGACRVVLNSGRKDIIERVRKKDPTLLSLISTDLVRHTIDRALGVDEFIENIGDFEEGSIGDVISAWIDTAFPAQRIEDVQMIRAQDPAKFEAIIASVYGGSCVN